MSDKIKVMIIDDSALIRNIVSKILIESPNIEVVGTAINGKFALSKLNKLRPDIIILDLEMPEMNGIEFLKERKKIGLDTPVIILSSIAKKGAQITLEALSLGASDFVLKPSEPGSSIDSTKEKLIEMVNGLGKPNSYKETTIDGQSSFITPIISRPATEIIDINGYEKRISKIPETQVVVIGISTGGPNALRDVLPLFPENFPVPIVIVQHMPAGFTNEFAISLDKICNLNVKEAEDNDIVSKGRILIAPGGKHVRFEKKSLATVLKLDDSMPVNGHKPSCDVLFESAASTYGQGALGVIMTGMGKDGADNLGKILNAGGITIAQDQSSSIVFGMPHVAIKMGNVNLIRPLNKIAPTIIDIVINKRVN